MGETNTRSKRSGNYGNSVPAVSLFFLHARQGQSILVRFAPNRWIIIDSNKLPESSENPTCEFLRAAMAKPNFELLAVVITHFHFDHMSGIPEVLDLLAEVGPAAERVFLPLEHALFRTALEDCAQELGRGYLRKLSRHLEPAGDSLPQLLAPAFVHKGAARGSRGKRRGLGPWLFAYGPRDKSMLKRYLKDELRRSTGESESPRSTLCELESWLTRNRNRFSTIMGSGCGCALEGLHFLLTSDAPGETLGEVAKDLRGLLDQFNIESLPLGEIALGEPPRLVPLSGATVPHHGSPHQVVKDEDLQWWRGEVGDTPLAIVQGSERAFGWAALEVFERSGFRIWTSAEPKNLLGGLDSAASETVDELEARMPSSPGHKAPAAGFFELRDVAADPSLEEDAPVCYLAVHGGDRGVESVVARGFYEVCSDVNEVRHHRCSQVFP